MPNQQRERDAFEYSLLHIAVPLEGLAVQEPSPKEFLALTAGLLDDALRYLHEQLDVHKGGGWEALSHNLLRLDRYLLVTFFLRRPKSS